MKCSCDSTYNSLKVYAALLGVEFDCDTLVVSLVTNKVGYNFFIVPSIAVCSGNILCSAPNGAHKFECLWLDWNIRHIMPDDIQNICQDDILGTACLF
jgi:hypothetical protein